MSDNRDVIQAIARLEALVEVERSETGDLKRAVNTLIEQQAAQQARVEAFWTTGKGAQWDDLIKANTAAIDRLNHRLEELETRGKVNRGKAVAFLGGAGLSGAGLLKAVEELFW